jgi:hypothetical protein
VATAVTSKATGETPPTIEVAMIETHHKEKKTHFWIVSLAINAIMMAATAVVTNRETGETEADTITAEIHPKEEIGTTTAPTIDGEPFPT